MRKVNALIKYEITNIKRGILIWIVGILYVFGVQQSVSSMFSFGKSSLTLVGYLEGSWLPLNFIIIPILLIYMRIGKSENEIFKTMDISNKEIAFSKIITTLIIDAGILLISLLIFIVIAFISKVSIGYFFYEAIGYVVNLIVMLIFCSFLGLFIGKVICKYVGDFGAFVLIIVLFKFLCNFYKQSDLIFPLMDIKMITSSFNAISYDKSYLYHNIFWIIVSFILFVVTFWEKSEDRKGLFMQVGSLTVASILCVYLSIGMISMQPEFYDIGKVLMQGNTYEVSEKKASFYSEKECGYSIEKYKMNINFSKENLIKNDCTMKINIDGEKVKTIELGLNKKLKISNINLDGQSVKFNRTNNSFLIFLPKEYKNGESIDLKVTYEGQINTIWDQDRDLFYIRNNAIFLADVFEWYPKLNDNKVNDFQVDIKYNGKNKIYSNLEEQNNGQQCKLEGKDKELLIISGNIIQRKYKGYEIIGNEEYANKNKQCDEIIDNINSHNLTNVKKIIFGPSFPAENFGCDDVFLWTAD